MDPEDEGSDLGYLGQYGVVIVPAPAGGEGAWFVTLARWSTDGEAYIASTDGPMFDDRDEAMAEAGRLIDWLTEHQDETDVPRAWDLMRQDIAQQEMPSRGVSFRLDSLR